MSGKSIKIDRGTVYQKTEGGTFYFRYQIQGRRKAVSLKTKNQKQAIVKAKELVPVVGASTAEVVAAHVRHANGWGRKSERLELSNAWRIYDAHPHKANPATVNIYLRYKSYFEDFICWAQDRNLLFLDQVSDSVAAQYSEYLRAQPIGVDTHNKRVERVGRVFRTLSDYCSANTSDWKNPNLKRRAREEIGMTARRLPFTAEQEEGIFKVLDDPTKKCINKEELKVMFYLGAYTGQRMKDCALLLWHKVDLDRGRIYVVQYKTGKEVTIPIAPQLSVVLEDALGWKEDSYVLPKVAARYLRKNAKGKDVGGGLVTNDVMRIIRWTGLEPSVKVAGRAKAMSVYGFHSLRHSFVTFCLDNNISKAVAVSILGANSKIIDQYYTHVSEESQEQAIQLISGVGSSMKQRYEKALEYLDELESKSSELIKVEKILRG